MRLVSKFCVEVNQFRSRSDLFKKIRTNNPPKYRFLQHKIFKVSYHFVCL